MDKLESCETCMNFNGSFCAEGVTWARPINHCNEWIDNSLNKLFDDWRSEFCEPDYNEADYDDDDQGGYPV